MTIQEKKLRKLWLINEIDTLRNSLNDPEVLKKQKELRDLKNKVYQKNIPKIQQLAKERDQLTEEIKAIKESKVITSDDANDFITNICRGVNYGPKGWVIKWISPKGKFIIATNGGYNCWNGIGSTGYVQTKHCLFDADTDPNYSGHDLYSKSKVKECEGKLGKETKKEWQEIAIKGEDNDR